MQKQPFQDFKSALLSGIQSNPDSKLLIDMLSWLFIQNKAFDQAFIQLKALQKRLGTNGQRLVELASVARKNQTLETAAKIYKYLIDIGPNNPYYFRARQGVLEVQYDRITKLKDYTRKDLKNLEKAYQQFMNDNRFSYTENGKVALRLAEIKALYLNKHEAAIDLLKKLADKNGRARQALKAKALLAMGDYYLLKGKEAEAQLTYTKVEKMREGGSLGNKATFRKAKLSFYKGNFDWAGSQLKILKGATSKMIANDALELDMLIKDNRGLDTTEVPLQIYARADMYLFKNQYNQAVKRLDTILNIFPEHNLTDEAYFAKAKVAEAKRQYDSATMFLKRVYENYNNDILADDALFKAAKLYEQRLDNPKKAKELYETLVTGYGGSIYQLKARDAFRRLRGDRIN
jgi:tetratricopeptide (TPR) repeat protein